MASTVVPADGQSIEPQKIGEDGAVHRSNTRDGPETLRRVVAVIVCAVILIACGELALYGKRMADARDRG